jgi:hypothetical protein
MTSSGRGGGDNNWIAKGVGSLLTAFVLAAAPTASSDAQTAGSGATDLGNGQQPGARKPLAIQHDDGTIHAGDLTFQSWTEYARSDYFRKNGARCGHVQKFDQGGLAGGGPSDCTYTFTNPDAVYDPSVGLYDIPVVVHVIRNSSGSLGDVSLAQVQSQIDVLNEDFLALAGSNGADGTDIQIQFYLAEVDPNGNATNGVTYSNNTSWYNDSGSYWNSLAWDTNRYLNIYTNSAGGFLGYVPDLPQGGIAGSNSDRVVVLWEAFGSNAPIGSPFEAGRTATHEVGHYFGLEHTFTGGCGGGSCNSSGDLICDTNPQSSPTFGCSGSSCGSADPIHNYMDYSDDLCMEEFTPEQARRMRCSLENYRPLLAQAGEPSEGACCVTGFADCPADLDGDGDVSVTDLLAMLSSWGSCAGCDADLTGDSTVDVNDLLALLSSYGPCPDGNTCFTGLATECASAGGFFLGANTTCVNESCEIPTGACCLGDESCTVVSSSDCASAGGTYQGNDAACTAGLCESGICGSASSGSCSSANGTPGCSDGPCCETVCNIDPFCCDVEWDFICVDEANDLCN